MIRTFVAIGLCLCTKAVTFAAPVPESKPFQPTVVARVKPLDDLLADARFVASLVARAAPTPADARRATAAIDAALDEAWGADWRKALDTTKPFFGYAFIAEKIGASRSVVLIPVREEAAFLSWLGRFVGKTEKLADGVHRFELSGEYSPTGMAIDGYLRFRDGYAYLTVREANSLALAGLPAPAQIMAEEKGAVGSIRVFVDRIPKPYRAIAAGGIGTFKSMLRGDQKALAGGMTPRWGMAEMLLVSPMLQLYPFLESIVQDSEQIAFNLRFDRQKLDLAYDLEIVPRPGSALVQQIATIAPLTSRFAVWTGDRAAASLAIRLTVPEELRTTWAKNLDDAMNSPPPDPAAQALARIGKSLVPTLRAGEIDLACSLHGPAKGGGYTAVAGVRVGNGRVIEETFKEMVKNLPKDAADLFRLDAATTGGVKVHHITLPPDALGPGKALFGEKPIRIAFKPDSVLATFGADADELLAAGLSAKDGPQNGVRVAASAKRLVPMIKTLEPNSGPIFEKVIGGEIDRVNIFEFRVDGTKTLRIHYSFNGAVLGMTLYGVTASAEFRAVPPVAAPIKR